MGHSPAVMFIGVHLVAKKSVLPCCPFHWHITVCLWLLYFCIFKLCSFIVHPSVSLSLFLSLSIFPTHSFSLSLSLFLSHALSVSHLSLDLGQNGSYRCKQQIVQMIQLLAVTQTLKGSLFLRWRRMRAERMMRRPQMTPMRNMIHLCSDWTGRKVIIWTEI